MGTRRGKKRQCWWIGGGNVGCSGGDAVVVVVVVVVEKRQSGENDVRAKKTKQNKIIWEKKWKGGEGDGKERGKEKKERWKGVIK